MTTQEKLVNRKLSIIELAEFLKNVSQACRINGVSRQNFYDIKKAYEEHGIESTGETGKIQKSNTTRYSSNISGVLSGFRKTGPQSVQPAKDAA